MAKLPVSQKYYDQTVLISELISLIKKAAEANDKITNVHFAPFVKGYDITFIKNETEIRISVKCRKIFVGSILKTYKNSQLIHKGIIKTKEDVCNCTEKILK